MGSQIERCTWDGERWTKADGAGCNEDHCAMRGRCANHVQHGAGIITCPSCIRRVRKDLYTISLRATLLRFDVEIDGIESEAMNLIGPAASPEQYAERRNRLNTAYDGQGWCDWPRSESNRPNDPSHPYAVLSRWAQALEDGGWNTVAPFQWTISRAVQAIDGALDRFAHGDEFEELARELASCRSHLDDVDHDSRTPDLGRPCPTCVEANGKGPRLRKRHASHPGSVPGQRCSDSLCAICDGRSDSWHCPDEPAHAWTDDEYRNRVDADYVQHADRLPVRELAERLGLAQSTVRRWANVLRVQVTGEEPVDIPAILKGAGRGPDGRKVYRVADARALLADGGDTRRSDWLAQRADEPA